MTGLNCCDNNNTITTTGTLEEKYINKMDSLKGKKPLLKIIQVSLNLILDKNDKVKHHIRK